VLKLNRYFIESNFPEIIRTLLKDDTMKQALVPSSLVEPPPQTTVKQDDGFTAVITLDREDEQDMEKNESDFTSSFEISRTLVEDVRKRCVELDFPLTEEYDFRNDVANSSLEIDLSPKCVIRDYQEKSLSKMFGGGGGRARSGIIVLPTGGKFLILTKF
jgi:DNA excision repair protein ERCC-3